jgi:hypothetical protein
VKRQEVKTENRHKEEGRRAVEQNDEGGSKRVGEQESGTVEVLCLAAGAARERAANDADVEPRRRLRRALGRRALHRGARRACSVSWYCRRAMSDQQFGESRTSFNLGVCCPP